MGPAPAGASGGQRGAALELHEEPYWIWRTRIGRGKAALASLLARMPDVELFLRFVELDGSTAGKDPGLLCWLRSATAVPGGTRATTRRSPGMSSPGLRAVDA